MVKGRIATFTGPVSPEGAAIQGATHPEKSKKNEKKVTVFLLNMPVSFG
jgi:hypothetical protein